MSAANFVGRECNGYCKSFHMKNGWGFMKCPKFSEDVFVSFNTSPELADVVVTLGRLEGQKCAFTVCESKTNPGTFEATGCRLLAQGGNRSGPIVPSTRAKGKGKGRGPVGTRCSGFFKSFNIQKGWGFITSDSLSGDIFVSFKTAPDLASVVPQLGDLTGLPATFLLEESKSNPGQYEARDVLLENAGFEIQGQLVQGVVKSFTAKTGWGFLRCPDIDSDIFVSLNTAPEMANIISQVFPLDGQQVSFMVEESKSHPGSFEATSVSLLQGKNGKSKSRGKGKTVRAKPY